MRPLTNNAASRWNTYDRQAQATDGKVDHRQAVRRNVQEIGRNLYDAIPGTKTVELAAAGYKVGGVAGACWLGITGLGVDAIQLVTAPFAIAKNTADIAVHAALAGAAQR